jgi:putative heme iron utilization protein
MIEYENGWKFSNLDTRVVPGGKFELISDFNIQWGQFRYTVPKGSIIDFASIPVGLRSLFNRMGSSRMPAAMHDHMYETKWSKRSRCDKMFYEALKGVGMSSWKARLYYWGVRCGGWTRGRW